MEAPIDNKKLSTTANDKTAQQARRRLLKALAATGGTLAVSAFLPGQWAKPVVEVGYLPAHAQASLVSTILTNGTQAFTQAICTSNNRTGNIYEISFDYENIYGDVLPGATVQHAYQFLPLGSAGSFNVVLSAPNIIGDGYQGTITYQVCAAYTSATTLVTTVAVTDVQGRTSVPYTFTTPKPVGALDVDQNSEGWLSNNF